MRRTTRRPLHGALVTIAVVVLVAYAAIKKLQDRGPNAAANQIRAVTERLPHFHDSVDCDAVFANDSSAMNRARQWRFDGDAFWASTISTEVGYTCRSIREAFGFLDRPLSEEERLFPIAYGLLVHSEATQVYFLLSAIYQPQNAYCIAVDGKSSETFKHRMTLLADCFPNIDVQFVGEVQWASYEIARGVFDCLRHLTSLTHPWRYYQYRSGVDVPLKTNLEMVRIFKQLNGSSNVYIVPALNKQAETQTHSVLKNKTIKPPLSIWASSLSALFSREAANAMVHNKKAQEHLEFIKRLDIPDEKLWGSILGNPKELPMPGGFDAQALYTWLSATGANEMPKPAFEVTAPSPEEPFALSYYFIGWYQTWLFTGPCSGRYTHESCVFGVGDLPVLYRRGELMAHKLYLNTEPAAFFCLYERVRLRAFDPQQQRFRGSAYAHLPQVQLYNGVRINDVHNVSY
ncbi:Protein GLY-15 a [Aphelenchoides avenae]|nr:Protein GLY-15 a [Aphelenchus avenae]KAH7723863.1 Protein GLY-15 a [Aphelenchus avenae]